MKIFDTISIRGKKSRNRIIMSPMCMYSSEDGCVNDFHLFHYTTRAMGGAGIIMIEATAVDEIGVISPRDLRMYDKKHAEKISLLSKNIEKYDSIPGIQLAHAGRKAGTYPPGKGRGKIPLSDGGWMGISPSPLPYRESWGIPLEMTEDNIKTTIKKFGISAKLSIEAGIEIIEIHAAHGYLIHEFLSPLSNRRTDSYGGPIENRMKFLLEIVNEIRGNVPEDIPLLVRISGNDFMEGGWDINDSVRLASELYKNGVDMIDCSSGGILPGIKVPDIEAYNLPISRAIKRNTSIMTSVVGNLFNINTMNDILINNDADMVTLGRLLLRDPYWPSRYGYYNANKEFFPFQYKDGFK